MLKIMTKKRYNKIMNRYNELTREYKVLLEEKNNLNYELMHKEYQQYKKCNKKKDIVSTETKSYDKDSYIKEYMQNYRSGCV